MAEGAVEMFALCRIWGVTSHAIVVAIKPLLAAAASGIR